MPVNFSNKDLKRLKELSALTPGDWNTTEAFGMLPGIIARLEAAEKEDAMTFTEDDLKRLKEEIEAHVESTGMIMTRSYLKRLLARLEATEEALQIYETNFRGYDDEALAAVKVWRKVCGK